MGIFISSNRPFFMTNLIHFYFQWTCVHDIQEQETIDQRDETNEKLETTEEITSPNFSQEESLNEVQNHSFSVNSAASLVSDSSSQSTPNPSEQRVGELQVPSNNNPRVEVMLHQASSSEGPEETPEEDEEEDRGGGIYPQRVLMTGRRRFFTTAGPSRSLERIRQNLIQRNRHDFYLRFTSMDVFEALGHIEMRRIEERRSATGGESQEESAGPSVVNYLAESEIAARHDFRLRRRREMERGAEPRVGDYRNIFFVRPRPNPHRSILLLSPWNNLSHGLRSVDKNHKIARNVPRLTNFIEEPNKGKGFIKELCFSADGRLICSPFDCGVRLMMFDENCSELSHCVQKTPQPLWAISSNICHNNCVVSTKFSPVDCLLVSGCLNGKIVWHQPVI